MLSTVSTSTKIKEEEDGRRNNNGGSDLAPKLKLNKAPLVTLRSAPSRTY